MTKRDKRLVAALTVLVDHLTPVVEDLLAGKLTTEGRALVAQSLRTIADDLDPPATVESVRGAVPVLPPARFPGPLAEPAVPISR